MVFPGKEIVEAVQARYPAGMLVSRGNWLFKLSSDPNIYMHTAYAFIGINASGKRQYLRLWNKNCSGAKEEMVSNWTKTAFFLFMN